MELDTKTPFAKYIPNSVARFHTSSSSQRRCFAVGITIFASIREGCNIFFSTHGTIFGNSLFIFPLFFGLFAVPLPSNCTGVPFFSKFIDLAKMFFHAIPNSPTMFFSMFRRRDKFQIVNVVIARIAVNMMYQMAVRNFAFIVFPYISMQKSRFAIFAFVSTAAKIKCGISALGVRVTPVRNSLKVYGLGCVHTIILSQYLNVSTSINPLVVSILWSGVHRNMP